MFFKKLSLVTGGFDPIHSGHISYFTRAKDFSDYLVVGINTEEWLDVITVYDDGETVQQFTGNQKPLNCRVILLDSSGKVIFFHDRGFSVKALNQLREKI